LVATDPSRDASQRSGRPHLSERRVSARHLPVPTRCLEGTRWAPSSSNA
jgi:hypothetical protein